MEKIICGFKKSDHFMYRQWDRGIPDELLRKVLPSLEHSEKVLCIISKRALQNIDKEIDRELFIKINGKILITCFFEDFQVYRGVKKSQNYLIINNLKNG